MRDLYILSPTPLERDFFFMELEAGVFFGTNHFPFYSELSLGEINVEGKKQIAFHGYLSINKKVKKQKTPTSPPPLINLLSRRQSSLARCGNHHSCSG